MRTETLPGSSRVAAFRSLPMTVAYAGVLLFVLVYCTRPTDWIPGTGGIPFAKILGVFAFGAFLLSLGSIRQKLPREVTYLILLFAQLCLTVPFSPIWRGGAFEHVLNFSKVVLITVIMSMTVVTLQRLRRVIFVQTASIVVIAGVTILQGNLFHGRLEGALGGDFSNPNDLGLAIALNLPFVFVFLLRSRRRLVWAAWAAGMVLMVYAVFRTASRSGALALAVVVCVCMWEFAIKGRRRYLLSLVGIAGLAVCIFASGQLRDRFGAIFDPPEDRGAYGSAEQRQQLLWRSLEVTIEHPLVGVGPGNFTTVSGVWRTTHNSYTLMSSEGGLPAFILYLMIFWRALANIRRAKRLQQPRSENMLLSGALRATLVGYLVGSLFSSVAYDFFPYLLVAYTTALVRIASADYSARTALSEAGKATVFDEVFLGKHAASEAS